MIDAQEKISIIIDYFLQHKDKKFDLGFVSDMQERIDEGFELTKPQERALENIITKFGIL